jgi:metal-responsive CopG/Arc/MetJ family transcriptional regulator
MYMKAIQVTFDEHVLSLLDADPEVKKMGRSAVLRQAALEYLRKKRKQSIAAAYRRGYAEGVRELAGWAKESSWPADK